MFSIKIRNSSLLRRASALAAVGAPAGGSLTMLEQPEIWREVRYLLRTRITSAHEPYERGGGAPAETGDGSPGI